MDIIRIDQLASARDAKILGKSSVANFLKWVNSADALAIGVENISIRELRWGKSPGKPSHEYLIMVLDHGALRAERDAPSWYSILSPNYRDKCEDTIIYKNTPEELLDHRDEVLATLHFRKGDVQVFHLALLLSAISEKADFYNVYTINCWWYTCCLWNNLAKLPHQSQYRFHMKIDWIDDGSIIKWNPIRFGRRMQLIHIGGVRRGIGADGHRVGRIVERVL
ncbi:hypothetical protein JAAARDRAFT_676298 [Jaapia argillacea MUCL 33604]|uniref:Uncharacterized protein n=1 Tax=Jaapia argillacea MUCL 33604 TaxID=933084 RepID=A0A067Q7U8_9AGAM|nr:hypothetical protein JAAARDRAFT_676298 [Jaapia argillacea MUCL 33604]